MSVERVVAAEDSEIRQLALRLVEEGQLGSSCKAVALVRAIELLANLPSFYLVDYAAEVYQEAARKLCQGSDRINYGPMPKPLVQTRKPYNRGTRKRDKKCLLSVPSAEENSNTKTTNPSSAGQQIINQSADAAK